MTYSFTSPDKTTITNGSGAFIPCDPANADYQRILASGAPIAPYVAPPPGPYILSKLVITRRLTDAELTASETAMASAPLRLQVEWRNANEVRSDDPSFPALLTFFTGLFGATRANAILARST